MQLTVSITCEGNRWLRVQLCEGKHVLRWERAANLAEARRIQADWEYSLGIKSAA